MNIKFLKRLSLFLIPFVFFACKNADEQMADYLVGNWEMSFIKVTMPTFQGKTAEKVVDIDFKNPKDRGKAPKMFYIFRQDDTFETWSEGIAGRKRALKGKWSVKKGKLLLGFVSGRGQQMNLSFTVEKTPYGFAMQQKQDRDMDGLEDDTYYVETNRLREDAFD